MQNKNVRQIKNLAAGERRDIDSVKILQVRNPATGATIAKLKISGVDDVRAAVSAAQAAFPGWRDMPVVKRCRILMRCKQLLEDRFDELVKLLVLENGKTIDEAAGEVRRGIEVVEFAAGMPSLSKGDFIENISSNIDGYIYREPLGVVTGACPFNFPAMIPLWMVPVAVACGNTFVLKPSEKCPMTADLVADIFTRGGLPPGVLNIVHGDGATFQELIAAPEVQAVSFVGSTAAAESVWRAATAAGKRCQALGGAKNFIFVMPDADPAETVKAVISSSFGCAGERCMASSILMLVGAGGKLLPQIVEAARKIRVGDGMDPASDMGPVITAEHQARILDWVEKGLAEGAELLLDGRAGNPGTGFFLGPMILDKVTPEMAVAQTEIFGPVLAVMRAPNLDAALKMAEASVYGNGASIFTRSGAAAREFRARIDCGMIGINAGVPAPMAFFSFGGRRRSFYGDLRAHGPDGVEFYTRKKAVIERWFDAAAGSDGVWGR